MEVKTQLKLQYMIVTDTVSELWDGLICNSYCFAGLGGAGS